MRRFIVLLLILSVLAGVAALAEEVPFEDVPADVDAPVPEVEWTLSGEGEDASLPEWDGPLQVSAPGAFEAEAGDPAGVEAAPAAEQPAAPTVISLQKSQKQTVYVGTTYQIEVPGKTVKSFKSSAKKVASVTQSGLVTPKKAGKAKITVKLSKKKKLTLTLKVVDPTLPKSVAIVQGGKAALQTGETLQLSAVVAPETATQTVKWKSGKKSVATVDPNGLVTAVGEGKAKITATSTRNGKKATLTLTVTRAPRPVENPYMISHAMGGVGGDNYTNSLEAFEENYAEGHRVFEVDIEYTSDKRLVLCHDWKKKVCSAHKAGYRPTYEEFMGCRIKDRYTPLSLEDLLRLMDRYPDIRVITDTKYKKLSIVEMQFNAIVSAARSLSLEHVLDRLTVEVYNPDTFQRIESIHHFNDYVFTLYHMFKKAPSASQLKGVGAFCQQNGIRTVAMYAAWWKPKYADILDPYGVEIALYTTNSPEEALRFLNDGVTALFTDFLSPV